MSRLGLLLGNELRVRWRELTSDTKPSTLLLTGGVLLLAVHALLWGLTRAPGLRAFLQGPLPEGAVLLAAIIVLALFPFGVATAISQSVVALFDRGDVDLLMASPIGSRSVFASRVLAVAAAVFVGLGLFMLPLASIGLLVGQPRFLGAIPTLASLSVVAACLGMLITLLLVRLLGARRARTVAQVVAALTGLVLIVVSQLPAQLAGGGQLAERLGPLLRSFEPGGLLAPDSLLWLPFRSMFLHPGGTLTSLALAGLALWGTVTVLHGAFARGVGSAEAGPSRRRLRHGAVRMNTAGALRVLARKEWKLILRDPFLISQVLLQVAYFLPAAYLLFRDPGELGRLGFDLSYALAGALVLVAGTVSSALARITVVGEEAPDLLAAAPLPEGLAERAKQVAVLAPVWAVAVPLAAWQLFRNPWPGLVMLLLALLTSFTVVRMRLWNPAAAPRKDLFKRRGAGDPVSAVLESLVPLIMAGAAYLAASGSWWALAALAAAGACVAVAFARAH